MLLYIYGFATKQLYFHSCVPYLNVKKLPNVVPYISQIVSYVPFVWNRVHMSDYPRGKVCQHYDLMVVDHYDHYVHYGHD